MNCANYLAARLKGLIALGASETLLMVCVAHGRYNLTLNIALTNGTFGSESFLIINDAVVVVVFRKESTDSQWLLALDTLKAAFVKVFVGHPQHFARTLFLAFSAVNFCFTCRDKLYCYWTFIFVVSSAVIDRRKKRKNPPRRANNKSSSELSGCHFPQAPKKKTPHHSKHNSLFSAEMYGMMCSILFID